ncbi:MAG: LysR family transcriptional regulator [Bacillota bacterium]
MNIEQLEYVIEIAKRGNITKAAESLHVSHSGVSQAISNLEAELGIPIFIRSRSGTKCTRQGEKVLQLSHEIINKITELKELGKLSSEIEGNLSISGAPLFFSTFLPEALHTFRKKHPYVQIEIDASVTDSIIEKVKNSVTDIGFILGSDETLKEITGTVNTHILYKIKLMVTVSKHSPLAKMDAVKPQDMLKYPLVIRNERASRKTWNDIFAKYGPGQVLFYTNIDDVTKNVIANNLAIGFFTDLMKNDPLVTRGDICLIPYDDPIHMPNYYLICIQTKNKYSSVLEKEFIKCTMETLENYLLKTMDS